MNIDNAKAQMRKGVLEYCILSILAKKDFYTSDIIRALKENDLIVVEGTLYPLLTRQKNAGLLSYRWEESTQGPPRKYYSLTENILPASILKKPDPNFTLGSYYDWYVKRRISSIGLLWNRSSDAWLGSHLKKEERSLAIKRLLEREEILEFKIADIGEIFYLPKNELILLEDQKKHYEAAPTEFYHHY